MIELQEKRQLINSLSLAPDVLEWLANSRHPRLLHVFDPACNLINERGEVLSIVTPQIGNGPFNLVVEDKVLYSEHLNIESPVSILDNQITFGDLAIKTDNAEIWNPRPDWEMLHGKRENILDQLTKLRITNYQALGLDTSFAKNHFDRLSAAAQGYSTTVMNSNLSITNSSLPIPLFSDSLISSLVTANLPSSLTATKQLAGLGQGLTPSGDDFILGAVLAGWIIHPLEVANQLAREIAKTAAPLTTSLSAAWLRSAGRGETGILWHEFFDALVSVDDVCIQKAMDKILAIGETSGADSLAGFLGMFKYWVEFVRSKVR